MKKANLLVIILSSIFIASGIVFSVFSYLFLSFIFSLIGALILLISYIKSIFSDKDTTEAEKKVISGDLTSDILENSKTTATREVLQNTVTNFENTVALQKYVSKELGLLSEKSLFQIQNARQTIEDTKSSSAHVIQSLKGINNTISKTNMLSVGISGNIEMLDSQISTQVMMIENSSDALHEMTSTIDKLDKLSAQTNQSADLLLSLSNSGKEAVETSSSQIEEIKRQASKIEEMVHIISKISEQTSILAMNAEIEAAHAGDVGKGFAVVADEVRKLAEDSATSSREIGYFVAGIVELIQNASDASDITTDAFNQIDQNINNVCNGVNEITSALNLTSQKSNGLLQNIQLVRDISDVISMSSQEIFQNAAQISTHMNEIRDSSNQIENDAVDSNNNLNHIVDILEGSKIKYQYISSVSEKLEKSSSSYITFEHPEFEQSENL